MDEELRKLAERSDALSQAARDRMPKTWEPNVIYAEIEYLTPEERAEHHAISIKLQQYYAERNGVEMAKHRIAEKHAAIRSKYKLTP